MTWEVTETTEEKVGDVPVVTKRLVGHVDNSRCPQIKVDIQLTLTTPADAKGPVPVMMEFGFGGFGPRPGGARARRRRRRRRCPKATTKAGPPGGFGGGGPSWQPLVLAKGWGYAIIVPNSIQADNGAGLTKGIIGLCNKGQPRKPDDWGALRAWAWGASRALDYFETDKAVDAKQVGIEGLSRYGKAALVAMAYDQRFAIGFIGSSGEGGAKLHRRNFGELVENLTGSGEYHWMAGNFLKYGGPLTPGDLPVDAHELIALCAPRPTFISYGASTGPGAEGQWVDQRGSFMAAVAAGPVFRLLGKKDLGTVGIPRGGDGRSPTASSPSGSTRGATPPARTGRRSWRLPTATSSSRMPRRRAGRAISDRGSPPMTDRIPRLRPAGLLALVARRPGRGRRAGRRRSLGGDVGGLAPADRAGQHAARSRGSPTPRSDRSSTSRWAGSGCESGSPTPSGRSP